MYFGKKVFCMDMVIRMIRICALVAASSYIWAHGAFAQAHADRALSLLADELRESGYTQISVTSRLVGGYVVEAQKDTVLVVIGIDGVDFSTSYVEQLSGPAGGFFATPRRPSGDGLDEVLTNYARRLASTESAATISPGTLEGPDIVNPRSAAFFQSQTISADSDTAVIRRSETLGILSPVVTETEIRTTSGDTTTHEIEHVTEYAVERASSGVWMNGMSGFSQQIFTDPAEFRNSLSVDVTVGSMPQPPAAGVIVDQVISSIEGNIGQMPESGRIIIPVDLREQITQLLTSSP